MKSLLPPFSLLFFRPVLLPSSAARLELPQARAFARPAASGGAPWGWTSIALCSLEGLFCNRQVNARVACLAGRRGLSAPVAWLCGHRGTAMAPRLVLLLVFLFFVQVSGAVEHNATSSRSSVRRTARGPAGHMARYLQPHPVLRDRDDEGEDQNFYGRAFPQILPMGKLQLCKRPIGQVRWRAFLQSPSEWKLQVCPSAL